MRALPILLAAGLAAGAATATAAAVGPDDFESALVKAGWTFIAVSDDTAVFMKDAAPATKGDARRVWTAYESRKVRDRDGFAFRSVQSLGEYDCANARSRTVDETFFAEPNLKGRTWKLPNFKPTEWASPPPGSVGDLRIGFACRARDVS